MVSTKFSWQNRKSAAISLSFDDARFSQLDVGIPILDRHGVKATFYVSPERLKQRVEDWKNVASNGHEIGNHSLTHPCSGNFRWARHKALEELTLDQMKTELDSASEVINQLLGIEPITFAYPCGQKFVGRGEHLKSYVPLVAERFIAARGWMDEGNNDPSFCDLAQLMARELDGLTFKQAKILIDEAVEQGDWLIFAGHDIGESGHQTTIATTLDSLCQYVNQKKNHLWIAPVQTVAEYILKRR